MTEQEWLECTDPQVMLEFLRSKAFLNEKRLQRKVRLFAIACCYSMHWFLTRHFRAISVLHSAELFADGQEPLDRLQEDARDAYREIHIDLQEDWSAYDAIKALALESAWDAATLAAKRVANAHSHNAPRPSILLNQAKILHDIVYPWRPLFAFSFSHGNSGCLTSTVIALAQNIYQNQRFHELLVLADALAENGCTNEDILNHLRSPGPHVKGCWALDLVLGKE